jgi:nicotinamide-nucleotide amidase
VTSLIDRIHDLLTKHHLTVSTAESCTSGLLAAALTESPGSSVYYVGGVNSYANEAKEKLLGVSRPALDLHGAVSAEVASEMASGIRESLGTDVAISTTGIAGPGGGTPAKPVGTVWLGFSTAAQSYTRKLQLAGDRKTIREETVQSALEMLFEYLEREF